MSYVIETTADAFLAAALAALTRIVAAHTTQRLKRTRGREDPGFSMRLTSRVKLRLLYGFDSPLQKELGYGKSLHDAMAEIHKRAIEGGIASVTRYLKENSANLRQTVYSEQPVEIHPAPGVIVNDRVDLIK